MNDGVHTPIGAPSYAQTLNALICGSGSPPPSLLRDLIHTSVTVFATCLVLAVYFRYWRETKDTKLRGGKESGRVALMGRADTFHWGRGSAPASSNSDACGGAFLSSVVAELWEATNVAVSNSIKETLDPLLKGLRVPVHFVKLDLGNVPIRTENMTVRPRAAGDEGSRSGVQIDVDVAWDGHPDVMLQANLPRLGSARSSAAVTFGVKRVKLSGRMHILLSPLTTVLPVVSAVQVNIPL